MVKTISMKVEEIRFPASRHLDGSDTMNPALGCSASYTSWGAGERGIEGHGFTLTVGRDKQICRLAESALARPDATPERGWMRGDPACVSISVPGERWLRSVALKKSAKHMAASAKAVGCSMKIKPALRAKYQVGAW